MIADKGSGRSRPAVAASDDLGQVTGRPGVGVTTVTSTPGEVTDVLREQRRVLRSQIGALINPADRAEPCNRTNGEPRSLPPGSTDPTPGLTSSDQLRDVAA